ncbi:MAG: DUF58 domain-containing protein [Armatimonadota bacterium]
MIRTEQADDARTYLLAPELLRKLERAAIASRHILIGRTKGERRSARRGTSVEFADYRAYAPGDDLRYLDWNAYARLERTFLKLFHEEEDLHIYALVDGSRSMAFGQPTKFDWAMRAAAALGYIGLCGGDRVQLFGHAEGRTARSRQFRGRGAAVEMFGWLSALTPGGETGLANAARWLLQTRPAPGLTFLISDLLTPEWETVLSRLAAGRGEVCVLQVLSREEMQPRLQGDLRLVDSETGAERELTMGARVLRQYQHARDEFLAAVRAACSRYGFPWLLLTSDQGLEDVILRSLRRLGVIR